MFEQRLEMLQNPQCFEKNRMESVSDHRWYETEEEAIRQEAMKLRYSLNGIWKFLWAPNPASAPEGFEKPEFSCQGWKEIPVPAQMELNGYGHPQYTDTSYPWDGREQVNPHEVPIEENPTGCYVKYFSLPECFKGKRIQLHFEGVETAFHCWINGHYVGYSEDSYTPAIFDVTDYMHDGSNKLAVEVYRFSTGSWLEDQDFWRMGGIIREVAVTAVPDLHMRDIDVEVDLTDEYKNGVANVKITVDKSEGDFDKENYKLLWKLKNIKGEVILDGEETIDSSAIKFSAFVKNVSLWSAECPNLYQLVLTVVDRDGKCIESSAQYVGFRKIEIKGSILYMNGKRLLLNGVNRHEFSGRKGRAIGEEEMLWDIQFLKQNNFNAVRTCHYPNQRLWYELCDKYGIYVMDETNLETHGTWHMKNFDHTLPGDFPEWKEACMKRAEAMLERDKNHPCIFSWSVGNESWSGQTLYDMSEYFRKRDASRPVHYENVCHDRKWGGTTDFESRMYATPSMAEEYLKDYPEKPYILCEYSHAMGNSCGNLKEYTDLFDKYPQYCGGFIWDYIDQALYKKNCFGEEYLAYGGDFDDRPTDYNFCTDGLIYADRTYSPKVQEVKYLYQPYRLYPMEDGITVESRQLFEDGSLYTLCYKIEKEGKLLKLGNLPFSIKPGEKKKFLCDLSVPKESGEYVITASLILKEDTCWGKAGHELCWGQKLVENSEKETAYCGKEEEIQIIDGDTTFSVKGENFLIQYQKRSGKLTSLNIGGKELVYDPVNTVKPEFWRAPTDNDEGNHMKERCAFWKTASLYPDIKEVKCVSKDNTAVISAEYHLGQNAVCKMKHVVHSDGTIEIQEELEGTEGLPELPCFGVSWKLPKTFSNVKWYGKGPEETYVDRCDGGKYGVYETTPEDSIPGYVIPQECGNHVETRWMTLTDKDGVGVKITSDHPFEFSVLPYTCHEMEQSRHLYELPRPYATVLRLLQYQTGVGGDNSWGAWAHDDYVLKSGGKKVFKIKVEIKDI